MQTGKLLSSPSNIVILLPTVVHINVAKTPTKVAQVLDLGQFIGKYIDYITHLELIGIIRL